MQRERADFYVRQTVGAASDSQSNPETIISLPDVELLKIDDVEEGPCPESTQLGKPNQDAAQTKKSPGKAQKKSPGKSQKEPPKKPATPQQKVSTPETSISIPTPTPSNAQADTTPPQQAGERPGAAAATAPISSNAGDHSSVPGDGVNSAVIAVSTPNANVPPTEPTTRSPLDGLFNDEEQDMYTNIDRMLFSRAKDGGASEVYMFDEPPLPENDVGSALPRLPAVPNDEVDGEHHDNQPVSTTSEVVENGGGRARQCKRKQGGKATQNPGVGVDEGGNTEPTQKRQRVLTTVQNEASVREKRQPKPRRGDEFEKQMEALEVKQRSSRAKGRK